MADLYGLWSYHVDKASSAEIYCTPVSHANYYRLCVTANQWEGKLRELESDQVKTRVQVSLVIERLNNYVTW